MSGITFPPPSPEPLPFEAPAAALRSGVGVDSLSQIPDDVSRIDIGDSNNLSWGFILDFLAGAKVTFQHGLKAILAADAGKNTKLLKYIAGAASDLLNLYRETVRKFDSVTIDADQTGPQIVKVNHAVDDMRAKIELQISARRTLINATDAYNAAVAVYNSDPSATDALKNLNIARKTYDDNLKNYHDSRDAAAGAVQDFQKEVNDYADLINETVNPHINEENQKRSASDGALLELQSVPTDLTSFSFSGPDSLMPLGQLDSAPSGTVPFILQPPTVTVPTSYPAPMVDPRTLSFKDSLANFNAAWNDFLNATQGIGLGLVVTDKNPAGFEYRLKVGTAAESYYQMRPAAPIESGGPGGVGATGVAGGLDAIGQNSLLSVGLVEQVFKNNELAPIPDLQAKLTLIVMMAAMTAGGITAPFGTLYATEQNGGTPPSTSNPAITAASGLAVLAYVVGLARSGSLQGEIFTLIGATPSLQGLTPDQQLALAENLTAIVSNSLVQTGVGTIAQQLGLPSLTDINDIALLLAHSSANQALFGTVAERFSGLITQFGESTIQRPLQQLISDELIQKGISVDQAQASAERIAASLAQGGLGTTAEALQAAIGNELIATLGTGATPELTSAVFAGVVTFTAAVQTKQDIQESIIKQAGAGHALTLPDDITQTLYGFSVDLSESTISYQTAADSRPTSALQSIKDNDRQLLKQDVQEAIAKAHQDFAEGQVYNTSLQEFQERIIDPGQQHFGLMYKGGATEFVRGSVDIEL